MLNDFHFAFQRQSNGVWVCIRAAEWTSPHGRIEVTPGTRFAPGTTLVGMDLAKILDREMGVLGGQALGRAFVPEWADVAAIQRSRIGAG